MGSQGARWGQGVLLPECQRSEVSREKERSVLKVSEGLRKVTIAKCPLNLMFGGQCKVS